MTNEEKQQNKDEFIKFIIEQAITSPVYERYMLKGGRQWCHVVTLNLPPSFLEELKTLVEEEPTKCNLKY